ncbi:methyltransferase domain-containing protein [Arsukibacterium sp.]|uniref:methyltransferase domain-containing protein n=1 Tax=Arsukibacterium sp. TaxID=1977258 RepID=UPI002FDA6F64
MKPALNENQSSAPQQWQQFMQGPALARAIAQQLQPWWQQVFGYYLLKVGDLSGQVDTADCKLSHQLCLGTDTQQSDLIARPDALPVAAHSVDAVLLSQCLEFEHDPHHVIREAHRVLIADGYLFLTGFNPYSLVGCISTLPWMRGYPWQGRLFSAARIIDWLHLIGFELVAQQRFFCASMLAKDYQDTAVNRFTEKYLHYFGACYLLVARKRELPLTPIRPKWQLNRSFSTAQGVSARQGVR